MTNASSSNGKNHALNRDTSALREAVDGFADCAVTLSVDSELENGQVERDGPVVPDHSSPVVSRVEEECFDRTRPIREFFHVPHVNDIDSLPLKHLIAVWTVVYKIPRSYVTELLKLLKRWNRNVTDVENLPNTCTTLLKGVRENPLIRKIVQKTSKVIRRKGKTKSKAAPKCVSHPRRKALQFLGHYVHFGLVPGLLFNTPGT